MNQDLQRQKQLPITPEEYGQLLDAIAPVSYAFHGRPPTMPEIRKLRDSHPKNIREHYAFLPDKHYPHVTAGDMVKWLETARPWARMHLKRDPVKNEAAYLAHSGDNANHFYWALAQERQGIDPAPRHGDEPQRQPAR